MTDAATLAHLLKYDSVHGRFKGTVQAKEGAIVVNGKEIKVFAEKSPTNLPWKALGVELVIESTGVFTSKERRCPMSKPAQKVLITAPAKGAVDATIVLGVNDDELKPEMQVVSNASCTTNSIAPIIKVLNDNLKIVKGYLTTVHATRTIKEYSIFPTRT